MNWLFKTDFEKYTTLVLHQVMNNHAFVSNLTGQKGYLEYKGRNPVAILLGESGIRELLASYSMGEIEKAIATFEKESRCLFKIFNVPVYYNPILERTSVMVIGDISWKTNERSG